MEVSVKSLGQLIDWVTPDVPNSETGHWRTACVYHGSRDAEWPLLTSLDDERRLFPGLGGLASELRGYYGLKRAADNGRQTSYSHPPN
jgi:hypothetical protein